MRLLRTGGVERDDFSRRQGVIGGRPVRVQVNSIATSGAPIVLAHVNVRIYRSDSRFAPYATGRVGVDAPTDLPNMRNLLRIRVRRSTGAHSLLLPAGIVALLLGLVGGLARIGVLAQFAPRSAVAWHGPLILFGFLGVLVAVERAVALRRP